MTEKCCILKALVKIALSKNGGHTTRVCNGYSRSHARESFADWAAVRAERAVLAAAAVLAGRAA